MQYISDLILISNASDGLGIGEYTSLRIDNIQHPQKGPCYFPAPTYKQLARFFFTAQVSNIFSVTSYLLIFVFFFGYD